MQCNEVRSRLAEYVAQIVSGREGDEPADTQALERHLAGCASCRAEAERLRQVEEALWAYPGVTPPASLVPAVMQRIAMEDSVAQEEWRVLPWDVWVPAVAFLLALLVAVASIPPHLLSSVRGEEIGGTVASWSEQVNVWLAPIEGPAQGGLLWAVMGAILATTAGLGISLAINAFSSEEVTAIESRVSDAASRFWDMARRAQ